MSSDGISLYPLLVKYVTIHSVVISFKNSEFSSLKFQLEKKSNILCKSEEGPFLNSS